MLATSALGVLAARKLAAGGLIDQGACWVVTCIYAAKASMLLLPEANLVGAGRVRVCDGSGTLEPSVAFSWLQGAAPTLPAATHHPPLLPHALPPAPGRPPPPQVLPTITLVLAATAPTRSSALFTAPAASAAPLRRPARPLWLDLAFAGGILIAVALARFAVFDVVQVRVVMIVTVST